jgi:hypothetical protein
MAKSSSSKAKASLVGKDLDDGPLHHGRNTGLAAGSFTHVLERAKFFEDKFRGSNLERELRKAVETFQLFIMPEGRTYAYSRGTGPVGLHDVRLGGYEEEARKQGKFVHGLSVVYNVLLAGDEEDVHSDGSYTRQVNIHVPSKFCTFEEISEGIIHAPHITKIIFHYKPKELWSWILEVKKNIYADAIKREANKIASARDRIAKLKDLAVRIP